MNHLPKIPHDEKHKHFKRWLILYFTTAMGDNKNK